MKTWKNPPEELTLEGQAARKGKSSAVAMALNGITHTMQRRSLNLTLEVLGVSHPDTVKLIADLYGNWYKQRGFIKRNSSQCRLCTSRERRLYHHMET